MNIRKLDKNEPIPYELLLMADPSKDKIDEYIKEGICFTATVEESVIGVYVLVELREDKWELINVAVAENMQGKGIGKALVKDCIKRAKKYGAKILEVGTGNSSLNQLALYQKCGFSIIGVYKDFFITHYKYEIYENGVQCKDMVRLAIDFCI